MSIENALAHAKNLADPDWCLSVPVEAKRVIGSLLAAVEAVREVHEHRNDVWKDRSGQNWEGDYCVECQDKYPCPTIEALDAALGGDGQ